MKKKEAINLKGSGEGCLEGFRGRKGKAEMELNYNLKKKNLPVEACIYNHSTLVDRRLSRMLTAQLVCSICTEAIGESLP